MTLMFNKSIILHINFSVKYFSIMSSVSFIDSVKIINISDKFEMSENTDKN